MKCFIYSLCAILLLGITCFAVEPSVQPMTIRVRGLKSDDGTVRVTVFDSEENFRDRKPLRENELVIREGTAEWVLNDLPQGRYAIRAYHDENDNELLDRSPMGIPEEPVGFSNNARARFGPPAYSEMEFMLDDSMAAMDITPVRMLSPGGQFGVGAAVVYTESPYKGAGYQVWGFPSITYMGRRLSVFGPRISYLLSGSDAWSLSAAGQVRFRALDPDDSKELEGMEERGVTFEAGLRLRWRGPHKMEAGLGAMTDVLGEHGGQDIGVDVSRPTRFGKWILSPSFGVLWQSPNLSAHYYGVKESEAREGRPEYSPGSTWTYGPNLGITCQVLDPWIITGSVGLECLGAGIADSPIVGRRVLFRGFFGIARQLGPGAAR